MPGILSIKLLLEKVDDAQLGGASPSDSHPKPFPFRSPLLGESLLVFVPLLSYMLKFSRCPHLCSEVEVNINYAHTVEILLKLDAVEADLLKGNFRSGRQKVSAYNATNHSFART